MSYESVIDKVRSVPEDKLEALSRYVDSLAGHVHESASGWQIDWSIFAPPGSRDWSVEEYMEEMRSGDRL